MTTSEHKKSSRPLPSNLIVVVSPPRAGSSMLASLLSRAAGHNMLPECDMFVRILDGRASLIVANDPYKNTPYAPDEDALDHAYKLLSNDLLANVVEHLGHPGRPLVLKAPDLCRHAARLHQLFDLPVRTVFLARDPRDIVASLMNVRKRQDMPDDIVPAIDMAMSYTAPFLAALEARKEEGDVLAVRYEDIVARDPKTLSELAAFTSLSLDLDGMEQVDIPEDHSSNPWYSLSFKQPVIDTRVDAYKAQMTLENILNVELYLKSFMDRFGYPFTAAS
ncbi:MAG: hypothetical protein JWL63_1440 [Rhodocyclales bacterium]|nr:hypothetical protein [Rhodocyclales bacterium]